MPFSPFAYAPHLASLLKVRFDFFLLDLAVELQRPSQPSQNNLEMPRKKEKVLETLIKVGLSKKQPHNSFAPS